jgi:hypothetical protein
MPGREEMRKRGDIVLQALGQLDEGTAPDIWREVNKRHQMTLRMVYNTLAWMARGTEPAVIPATSMKITLWRLSPRGEKILKGMR